MTLQTTLSGIGLNDKEIKVYLALLKAGKTTPAALSKTTKINRPTVYNVISSLQLKGIIAQDLSGKTLYVTPLPPKSLEKMVERPQRELNEKKGLIQKAIDELALITADKEYPVPKIRFIEENNLKDFLYENITTWQQAAIDSDNTLWGFQDKTFAEEYQSWIEFGWNTAQGKHKDYKVYFLTNESTFEKKIAKKYANRSIKFLNDTDFTSTVWVAGDYLVMVVTQQHPFYLVEIHDKTLAHNMREIFKKLWSVQKTA
jgi:sugar-specific transcriptional regulator TrmB